jgi:hypothetical protein
MSYKELKNYINNFRGTGAKVVKNLTVDRYSDALFVAGSEYKTASLVVGLLNGENTVEDLRESVSEDMKTLIKQEMKERS